MTTSSVHATIRQHDQLAIDRAVAILSVPRHNPADSFVLHAPLELMARVGLLAHLPESARPTAIERIEALTDEYLAAGEPVDAPADVAFGSVDDGAHALVAGIGDGDLDAVDAATVWLAANTSTVDLRRRLAGPIARSLGAAGHAPIGFYLLDRVAGGVLPATLLRGPLREVARHPDWQLNWMEHAMTSDGSTTSLLDALCATPNVGQPESTFIRPLMSHAEASGLPQRLVGPLLDLPIDPIAAEQAISRVAAWSMLHDDPDHAPYGWSHCLTMPQAVIALADRDDDGRGIDGGIDRRTALAIAATFVIGFRCALGNGPIDPTTIHTTTIDPAAHTQVRSTTELAAAASSHHDAHLVKYTLACIHAAERDRTFAKLYLAAAGYLGDWWAAHPE